jgi:hypothetical protein
MTKLTDKQEAFICHYLVCLNATEAAFRAGYSGSRATLAAVGYENLRKPHIRAEIDRRMAALSMSANEVVFRLTEQATADFSEYMVQGAIKDDDGEHLSVITLDLEAVKKAGLGRLIKKITNSKYGPVIEFYDAQAALMALGRRHGLFTDRVTVDWQKELEEAGISPGDLYELLVQRIAADFERSDQ